MNPAECRAMLWETLVLLLALSLLAGPAAGQATITVDAAADNTTAGDGACTLREAILNANSNTDTTSGDCTAGVDATDAIAFNIDGGGGTVNIQPTSELPTITEGVTIDGTTQGCFGGFPCIELDGTAAGSLANGLRITGSNSTVKGLVINRFEYGIEVSGAGATGNTIVGNYIGTDLGGTAALGNNHGVVVFSGATNNTIGGTAPGPRNVISGNNIGVVIIGSGTTGNVVQGNFIGTAANGSNALGNVSSGVDILGGASSNTIGGTVPSARNVISGNITGVFFASGGPTGNVVQGNFIGTDVTGTVDLGDSFDGVVIVDDANTIGGTAPGAGNVISGNNSDGVRISGAGNVVQGNFIGTDVTGTVDLGNSDHGVVISGLGSAANNTIGGTATGAANTIAFNANNGVTLTVSAGTGNAIQRNSIFNNTLLGIDLGFDGATANDPGDPDTGPNKLQNFPTLTAALIDSGGTLLVTFLVDTDPANATYPLTVEFFEADADDQEGRTFLGADSYTTGHHPGTRQVSLGSAAALGVSTGDRLVAAATDADSNTSEFSPAIASNGTRYVAPTGSDAGNTCINPAAPCATIGHAVGQANAGDILDVAAGTYNEPGLFIDKALHVQGGKVVVQ